MRVDRRGRPLTGLLTGGQQHDAPLLPALLEQGTIRRGGRGRPRRKPVQVCGDKGYTGRPIRGYLRRHGIGAVIPYRINEKHWRPVNRAIYRERNVVERLFNRLKQCRRIATRYEKLAENYRAMVTFAMILLWL